MTPGFRQLLNRYAMLGFEHQMALTDLLGPDPDWRLLPKEGKVIFGTDNAFSLHVLGTRSDESNTWLWAWANESAGVPDTALESAKKVRQVGRKRSIGELGVETLPLDNFDFDAHTLALVATAVAGLPAYYRFPYKGGVLFAALDSPALKLPAPDVSRMTRVIAEVVDRIDLDERTALISYLEAHGAKVEGDKRQAQARWPDGRVLRAAFNENGRLDAVRPRAAEEAANAH